LVNGGLEVAGRRNLEYVYRELNFQMSGDVSDETALSIGKFLAAEYVITGQIVKAGGRYRCRVSSVNVETAVQESSTRLDVRDDRALQNLITGLRSAKVSSTAYNLPPAAGTAGVCLDRGILHATRDNFELAIAKFSEAIGLDGTLASAYVLRGRAYAAGVSRVVRIEEDFRDFTAAFEPRYADITAEQKAGYNQAIADYPQAPNLAPNLAAACRSRGAAYTRIGDYDKALADFNRVADVDPDFAAAYYSIGDVYSSRRDDDQAIAEYSKADTTFGTNAIYAIAYGDGKFMAGNSGGKAAYSADGVTWTAADNTTFGMNTILSITYGGGKLVAGGDVGKMAYWETIAAKLVFNANGSVTWTKA
jgi:tetratricopeptide (TPR) repeat protein